MITKLQAEKERIQETARQRQKSLDVKLQSATKTVQQLEQQLKQA